MRDQYRLVDELQKKQHKREELYCPWKKGESSNARRRKNAIFISRSAPFHFFTCYFPRCQISKAIWPREEIKQDLK